MTFVRLGKGAEFDLIRGYLERARADVEYPESVRVGPGDDCTIVRGEGIAISIDKTVEGVHFMRDWLDPEEIGYRAVASALSDLAAVAATPIGVLVALAMSKEDMRTLSPRVMEGARAAAAGSRAALLGGDLSSTDGPIVIDVVVVGNAVRPVLRRGARPGDALWVTGELGAAACAVRAWKEGRVPEAPARFAFAIPTPRVAEAVWLAGRGVITSMIDISDGIAGDVGHLAAAGDVRILIDASCVPIHPAVHVLAQDLDDALDIALTGGEDYELLFTAPSGAVERLRELFVATFGVTLTCIGSVHDGAGIMLRDFDRRVSPLEQKGFDHFGGSSG
jgi:thiamine-monophosphate kinase